MIYMMIMDQTNLSQEQLRSITAQIVERELLHYIEARTVYITADKGYIFLDKKTANEYHTN